jgi:hypothetical protein
VYKLTPGGGTWSESVHYSFSGGSDGAILRAGVVFGNSRSVLYGATTRGGSNGCGGEGCGTVYEFSHSRGSWTESIPYPPER